ncbi:MAG: Maf family protein [Acidobacteriota bacterium]
MLVLASASPRRRELLAAAGIALEVVDVTVDERLEGPEPPGDHVRRLALAKAEAGLVLRPSALVLGADTIVVAEGEILGKPRSEEEATRMLQVLSGREHEVVTGVALVSAGGAAVEVATTRVWFTPMTDQEIAEYVESGEGRDKAGGYAIQGLASKFVDRIQGNYTNVVGLPVALVYRLLKSYSET